MVLETTNSKVHLSSDLLKVSVRVRNRDPKAELGLEADQDIGDAAEWYEINGADGPSRAVVRTKNSKACAGFVGDSDIGGMTVNVNGVASEGKCVVM